VKEMLCDDDDHDYTIVTYEYVTLQSLYRTVPGIGVYFCTLHYISHRFKYVYGFLILKANSAFHSSGVGKWVPASAGRA